MEANKQHLINHLLATNNFTATNDDVCYVIKHLGIIPTYPIILVGGTNGKGSTCAYLTTILTNAGYKVGTFTSPHVFEYNERIQINNKSIADEMLNRSLSDIITASPVNLGLFKTFTLAAHQIFIQQQVDIAVIEVGLGGKHDCTNLFEPTISAITNVELDHCEILGYDRESIAKEKAGIFRANKEALFGSTNIPQAIQDVAIKINTPLDIYGQQFSARKHDFSWDFLSNTGNLYSLPLPSMRGNEQIANASLAIAILQKLRTTFPVSSAQIKQGLLQTQLIGRFQVMPGIPQIIFDTAHNPQAIELMCQNMIKLPFAKKNFAVFSIADDKDWQSIITRHATQFDYWYLAKINSPRSVDPTELKTHLMAQGIAPESIQIMDTITDAFNLAYSQLTTDDRVVCFGSFLVVEEAYQALQRFRK